MNDERERERQRERRANEQGDARARARGGSRDKWASGSLVLEEDTSAREREAQQLELLAIGLEFVQRQHRCLLLLLLGTLYDGKTE